MKKEIENGGDCYLSLSRASEEVVFKEKGSKFLAYAFPVSIQEAVDAHIAELKKRHPKARHWCYAWQIGAENPVFRYNDDGEPNNSAGKPIFGQIQSFELTDILIVVVRYFGGTKLGVGGLVAAYRTAAKMALENANIVEKILFENIALRFDYVDMDKVMRIVKEDELTIDSQKMEMDCLFYVSVRKSMVERVLKRLKDLRCVQIKRLN